MNQAEFQRLEKAVDISIERILTKGTDDLFRPPVFSNSIETEILSDAKSSVEFKVEAKKQAIAFLKNADLQVSRIGLARRSLVAKDENTFRQVAWLDPFDAVKYLALAVLALDKIEPLRPSKADGIVHSHRSATGVGGLFDENFGYDSFRARSSQLSNERIGKWKVITDIANFFDRVRNHTLENHLLDAGLERKYAKLISEVLFFWAGDRRSFGIPVGSDASRVLAEAILMNVDQKMIEAGITFVRYVDDYRIFADTKAAALKSVAFLTTLLAEEGLTLNSKKTDIFQIIEPTEVAALANRFADGEHEVIDLDEKIEIKRLVRVSGRSSISKFYREPGKEALKKIKLLPKQEIIEKIVNCSDAQYEDHLKLSVKYFVYADHDTMILRAVLARRLTSVIYISDALIKERDKFTEDVRNSIRAVVFDEIDWFECAYPLQVPVLRLAACPAFFEPRYANQIVDRHLQSDSLLFFREAISLGYPCLDRARIRALATSVFGGVPAFLQRAIFCAVKRHDGLSDDEKRPLLKNMKQHSADWFVDRIP